MFQIDMMTNIFIFFTRLGDWQVIAGLGVVAIAVLRLLRKKREIIFFLTALISGEIIKELLKLFFHRARPDAAFALIQESGYSFPSGHAILAVALYGFLIYFFWKYFKRWKKKVDALFLGFLIIILLGFSRLYLGVHYISDVWAGYMIGLFWLTFGIGLVESKKTFLFSAENDSALLCFTKSCLAK